MVKFLDLNNQYIDIKDEIDKAIKNVINDSAFIGGKYLKKFEEDFAEYQEARYCIGVANGTDGLEIVLRFCIEHMYSNRPNISCKKGGGSPSRPQNGLNPAK